jgi:hypothetical protein
MRHCCNPNSASDWHHPHKILLSGIGFGLGHMQPKRTFAMSMSELRGRDGAVELNDASSALATAAR